ncbi:MAG TPA: hypothetical protein ENG63_05490 [Candidatus Desulfofervidus auxilii]|uniref:Uncharacterized protein n=1 Tax=Desulfofervidus auxilii TaxID=1621989 RepID=A0A7C0U2M0_DESA2|nr:hypothetical protein [Candidatus Desulfofervidus auxilii]
MSKSELKNLIEVLKASAIPSVYPKLDIPKIPDSKINPARWTYKRLIEYIRDFEKELDEEHEIGARLVSFGQVVTFHIQDIGYYGPDIITFYGITDKGERVQLIQHISQLNVLLVAMPKLKDKPRRIGFIREEGEKFESESEDKKEEMKRGNS